MSYILLLSQYCIHRRLLIADARVKGDNTTAIAKKPGNIPYEEDILVIDSLQSRDEKPELVNKIKYTFINI